MLLFKETSIDEDYIRYRSMQIKQRILYDELNFSLKRKWSWLIPISNADRQIGKTFTLVHLANKYNCPIAIPFAHWGEHIQAMSFTNFNKRVKLIVCSQYDYYDVLGCRFDVVLCEEQIQPHILSELMFRCNCLIGYKSI